MPQEIRTINLGGVNCFLVRTGDGFILIDTGFSTKRTELEKELASAGCKPGNLKLILLSHGDVDHTGNAAYLREKYGARIAMHNDDSGMVERGDMRWNRKARPDRVSILGRFIITVLGRIMPFFERSSKFDTFKPDMYVEDGHDLSSHGFDAKVIRIPGHSKGSIGILTTGGDLYCGDLFANIGKPAPHFMIDDLAAFNASVEKLKSLGTNTVYPGHGKPFSTELFMRNYR